MTIEDDWPAGINLSHGFICSFILNLVTGEVTRELFALSIIETDSF